MKQLQKYILMRRSTIRQRLIISIYRVRLITTVLENGVVISRCYGAKADRLTGGDRGRVNSNSRAQGRNDFRT